MDKPKFRHGPPAVVDYSPVSNKASPEHLDIAEFQQAIVAKTEAAAELKLHRVIAAMEPDARRGRTVRNAAKAGGKARKALTPQQSAAAKAEREKLIKAGHTKTDACHIVGENLGVSYKTIDRLK